MTTNTILLIVVVIVVIAVFLVTRFQQGKMADRQQKPPRTRTVNDSSYQQEDNITPDRPADASEGPQLPPKDA